MESVSIMRRSFANSMYSWFIEKERNMRGGKEMEPKELMNMRLKQVAVLNGMLLTAMILYFMITKLFTITFAHFYLVLGVWVLIQGVFGLVKGDSTKSIIPILEKIAIYEKQKMGNEWYKQRKVSYIWNIVFSGFLFWQSYLNWGYTERVFQIEMMFMTMIPLLLLVMLNVSLYIHIRKVDRANSQLEMKGYTLKSNLIAVVVGIVFAFVMITIMLFYIMSGF